MSIEYEVFLEWAESRFDDVIASGSEVKINSIFCDDRKHHLWCSPSGGKKEHEYGVYHCWKTDKKGSLIGLVMLVDDCSFDQAASKLGLAPSGGLEDLERRVNDMFAAKQKSKKDGGDTKKEPLGLEFPPDCYLFDDLPTQNRTRIHAQEYLHSRSIPTDGLMVCTAGRYRNRIVIPYLDRDGHLIYYNGRYIGDPGQGLRYLGPPKELGIGKGDVLYSRRWPSMGEKVYIAEGEIDSMSLDICGFRSVALGGKNMTDKQVEMIKGTVPVLCLDADDSGGEALPKMANKLKKAGFQKVNYVRPSKEYKDWNGLLVARGPAVLSAYVRHQEKEYDTSIGGDWEGTILGLNSLLD